MSGILAVSLLAGCAVEKKAPASGQKTTNVEAPVTIDYLAYAMYAQPDSESQLVKEFEKKFNVKFNFWMVDDSRFDENLNIKLAAGEVPDVWRLRTRSMIAKYLAQGVLGELPIETIKKYAPDYIRIIEKYDMDGVAWITSSVNGKNYGLPSLNLDGLYPTVVVWRLDWLKNVGIEKVPETLTDIEEAFIRFRNHDPDQNGKKDTYALANHGMNLIFGAFGVIPMKDYSRKSLPDLYWSKVSGKYVFSATRPEAKEGLAVLRKWYQEGLKKFRENGGDQIEKDVNAFIGGK